MTDPSPPLPWTARARRLRRDQTDCEALLWSRLRNRRLAGCKFHRQFAIGPYVVDFVCREHGLVVEVDGGQHAERCEQDEHRTQRLAAYGFRVLRFWNKDVIDNLEGVLLAIEASLSSSVGPTLKATEEAATAGGDQPSPQGRGCERSERVRGSDSGADAVASLVPSPRPSPQGEGEEEPSSPGAGR